MSSPAQRAPLPDRAADTSPEQPWPVRLLSMKIAEYVEKMSVLWVEGQVVQLTRRPGARTAYLTLRDPDVDMSLSVAIQVNALDAMPTPLSQGARVVLQAKPVFWTQRGSLMLDARQIRPVGVGELLARVEHLKQLLASEGVFDPERKKPLPFLPRTVGLVCGRASAAEKDVVENARRRWPSVRFAIREVAVQGPTAVQEVTAALAELDADPEVDVVVIARGGGSVEDLLPFSNEALVRAVAAARTPVVSAIGHDVDTPLLDHVADWRASTPTDAGKRVVPDAHAEREGVRQAAERARGALRRRVEAERRHLVAVRSRPVMADPSAMLEVRRRELDALRDRARHRVLAAVHRASDQVGHLRAQVRALSPQSTLERGYAVVQHRDGRVVLDQAELEVDELLRVRVARGDFGVRVAGLS
ncbi:exodeoxyribonuclease VII large subunit [Phycicoccus sp. M110.8]|uniref:exodeoxyribonuclease VII large subunit n=1 Tax=Phycicoccus sp. M110.8 TaxID=3075433 RepID=UPI0028FD2A89|nr:exodeoxyribonuclease VII large subunit [Phycicoccus sp. M110.8]MDU0314896.1 exodeoxyribonuclease VII large subunit [Phycicoccus sp. M110.8]HET8766509.1 exodeoxyribonuclease VII large subunit [Pedococcus sp.]